MILALGARGPGFKSRTSPLLLLRKCIFWILIEIKIRHRRGSNPWSSVYETDALPLGHCARCHGLSFPTHSFSMWKLIFQHLRKRVGSGGIRTHASEETGALNQRLRPLGHATHDQVMPNLACYFMLSHKYEPAGKSIWEEAWSLWRNRLARSAVNRKVGGSSPPRDGSFFLIPLMYHFSWWTSSPFSILPLFLIFS